ncbi:MAG: WD40 repeat domain-containing protein, partial [Planctomycetota bacterium]
MCRSALGVLLLLTIASAQETTESLRLEREIFILEGRSSCLAWSPDGSVLACGGNEGEVTLIAYPSGRILQTLEASDHWIGELVFSPDSQELAVSGRDLSLWRVADGNLIGRYPASSVGAMDWSRDGSVIACIRSGEKGAEAVVLQPDTLTEIRRIPLSGTTAIDAVALTPDGRRLALGRRSGVQLVFDTQSGERLSKKQTGEWVQGLCFLDNGELMRLGWNGTHRLFGGRRQKFGKYSYGFRVKSDGIRALIRTRDRVAIFRPDGDPTILVGSGPLALHPDGLHWARAIPGQLEVFAGERPIKTLPSGSRLWPRNLVLAENGSIIVATDGSRLFLFDAETG